MNQGALSTYVNKLPLFLSSEKEKNERTVSSNRETHFCRINNTSCHQILIFSGCSIITIVRVVIEQHLMAKMKMDKNNEINNYNIKLNMTRHHPSQWYTFSMTTLPLTPAFLAINFIG